ncbi:protein of unknown function DUF1080 [Emticicia oligotrophica DSM 17448]|uniref:3-keto-alpha-glucoside-1,2-lyase/3-keto-2-hydroxy-glucal hydratase domain-containing protein n=1 Tax=Emticicia oligotrophica (strain DSM 17448 / CIP 109782 / MTCC 6937 / GPTSA100-15) TaxID=929562 RepID=A0ABN4ALH0_EMTOG|nr:MULTISPECIES: DUF1080 domain-containing protein [Emticicia]AFK02526.1 protein of unknown function DUF1080 [Emticicia oligotrophica DSM 17448]
MQKLCLGLVILAFAFLSFRTPPKFTPLFDGKTFKGWEGDIENTWRIAEGVLIGGYLDKDVPHNNFLCTTRNYANFILKLKIKLTGNKGFINSGIQFRSQRLKDPAHEMTGYQADYGEGYWGTLYDESRRNKTIAGQDPKFTQQYIRLNDWNDYELRAEGRHIQIFINGKQTTDYTEPDLTIPQTGLIGLQIHGGGAAQVFFKDIQIQELP